MIEVRRSSERGHLNHGWLDTYHTFSFASYHDPNHMGFRALRVINEDRVRPGEGFSTHPHRDMEVISYVIEGALEHKDSMGNRSVISSGEVQRMSAGTGITHSEYNQSNSEVVHFLQIWIVPEKNGLTPSYEQKRYKARSKSNQLCLIGSHDGRDDSVVIQQDVNLFTCILESGSAIEHSIASNRHLWIQVISGEMTVDNKNLNAGDGCSVSNESSVNFVAQRNCEFIVFDLA